MEQNPMNMDAIRQAELKAEAKSKADSERKADAIRKAKAEAEAERKAEDERKEARKADALAEEALYPRVVEGPESNIGKTVIDKLLECTYIIYGIEAEYNLYKLSPEGTIKLPFDYRKDRYNIV